MGQFRYILTNLGEKMSDEEVDELLKAVDTSSGELNYMGELLRIRLRKIKILTTISCRHGQDDPRKLRGEDLMSLLFSSFLFHGMKRSLHGYWRLMACICEGIGKKDFVIPERQKQKLASGAVWCTGQVRAGRGLLLVYSRSSLSFRQCIVSMISRGCRVCWWRITCDLFYRAAERDHYSRLLEHAEA